jgi:gluconolactonase
MPIEQLHASLSRLIDPAEPIRWLADNVATDTTGPAEGPLWWPEENCLYLSDVKGARRLRWSEARGLEVVATGTRMGNGLTRDRRGRLLACELEGRRVSRWELGGGEGSHTVIARGFAGKPLNMPNDIVAKSDGSIYFTDPWSPIPPRAPGEFDRGHDGVFRIAPDLSDMTLIIRDLAHSNGLCFSPDEKTLYVNDYARATIRAWDMKSDGTPDLATDRLFCHMKNDERAGMPDGMKCDLEGNVYCGGSGGLWLIDPKGRHLGTIAHGETKTTNLAFGGPDRKTLFFTTHHRLGAVRTRIAGVPVPRGPLQKDLP